MQVALVVIISKKCI